MLAEYPEIARLDVGLLGWLGHVVGIGQARLRIVAGQVAEQSEQPGIVHGDARQ
jgi:hypothetical protein